MKGETHSVAKYFTFNMFTKLKDSEEFCKCCRLMHVISVLTISMMSMNETERMITPASLSLSLVRKKERRKKNNRMTFNKVHSGSEFFF